MKRLFRSRPVDSGSDLKVSASVLPTATDMRWGMIAGVLVSIGITAGAYVLAAEWAHENTCLDLLPPARDPAGLQSIEAPELMKALSAEYASSRRPLPGLTRLEAGLTRPLLVVAVSGKAATVRLAGPASDANFMYAAAWARVWGSHHGNPPSYGKTLPCVNLTERWDGGSITLQPYPIMY
jgi:hypothetical protein